MASLNKKVQPPSVTLLNFGQSCLSKFLLVCFCLTKFKHIASELTLRAGFPLSVFLSKLCKNFACIINPSVYDSLALFQRFFLFCRPQIQLVHKYTIQYRLGDIRPSLNFPNNSLFAEVDIFRNQLSNFVHWSLPLVF